MRISDWSSDVCSSDLDYLRRRRYIGSKDRRAVTALTYDILRHRARIGWWLVRAGGVPAEARQQVLAYLLCSAGESPESLRGLFDGARYAPPPLTSEEAAPEIGRASCKERVCLYV